MTAELAQKVKEIIESLLGFLGIKGTVTCSYDGEAIAAEVRTDDPGVLIGKGGHVLEALQYIVQRIAGRSVGEAELAPIVVDVEGYKKKRETEISRMAREIAERVSSTGRSVLLQPMAAWERKIVHIAVRDKQDLETESEDSESGRRVRIRPKTGEPGAEPGPGIPHQQE